LDAAAEFYPLTTFRIPIVTNPENNPCIQMMIRISTKI